MRLVRHLSFSNVIAMLALFIALGGAAYAGTKINGNSIKNGSIGGGKLKKETITANKLKKGTITGAQIAPGTITSSSINESTLGTVPSAQSATTAGTATKANSATKAATATSAESAKQAETAKQAESAKHAETADSAKHAETADSANHADSASTADSATTAGNAYKLGGKTPAELKGELELTCGAGTEFFGGMCWDESVRPAKFWLVAVKQCGEAGGRLPSIEELIAYVLQPGLQVAGQTWSADLDTLEGGEEAVFTSDETSRSTSKGIELGYRCVFPQSN
jgi:hypothetical protein